MKLFSSSLLFFGLLLICNSGCFNDSCDGVVLPQAHRLGDFSFDLIAESDNLEVGDSIHMEMNIDQAVFDSISMGSVTLEDFSVQVIFGRTDHNGEGPPLVDIFDEHFETIISSGLQQENISVYHLESDLQNFKLDLSFVTQQTGAYYISTRLLTVFIADQDIECMDGDVETWDAKIIINSNSFENTEGDRYSFTVN